MSQSAREDHQTEMDKIAVQNLKLYLTLPSNFFCDDFELCVSFLAQLAKDIGLTFDIFRMISKKPNAVLTWRGTVPQLKSIMLNSRIRITQSLKSFESIFDDNPGNSKRAGIQYLEAIRRLKSKKFNPKRSVHVTFLSDFEEEHKFVESQQFKLLNVGFAIDEGASSEDDTITAYESNKRCWKFVINCNGTRGHSSLPLDNTAGQKVQFILNKLYKFRQKEKESISRVQDYEDIITINLTGLKGGAKMEQIPKKLSLYFDTRCPLDKFDKFSSLVKSWCEEAGENVFIENCVTHSEEQYAKLDDNNPFWVAMKTSIEEMNIKLRTGVAWGKNDGSQLRAVGVPTVGFCPSQRTSQNEEILNEDVFLNGVDIFEKVIAAINAV